MKKVRKPKDLIHIGRDLITARWYTEKQDTISIRDMDLKGAKKLHAWLTKAIKYLEQK